MDINKIILVMVTVFCTGVLAGVWPSIIFMRRAGKMLGESQELLNEGAQALGRATELENRSYQKLLASLEQDGALYTLVKAAHANMGEGTEINLGPAKYIKKYEAGWEVWIYNVCIRLSIDDVVKLLSDNEEEEGAKLG